MPKTNMIFISYRRSDSTAQASRIYDCLVRQYGKNRVFKDVNSIPYGADFSESIDAALRNRPVVLVIIGKAWLTAKDTDGIRRLDKLDDYVRLEIESALKHDSPIIPVLLDRAKMPRKSDLPESLQLLSARNAIEVDQDPRFRDDIARLIERLQDLVSTLDGVSTPISEAISEVSNSSNQTDPRSFENRYLQAIERLDSENAHICLYGIRALGKLAKDSPADHWTIMEVLTTFIRDKSPVPKCWVEVPVSANIQAALAVLRDREFKREVNALIGRGSIDLSNTNLTKADLCGVSLIRANLRGSQLRLVDLSDADLSSSNLSGASFLCATLCDVNLSNANLRGADLSGAQLDGANLSGADLSNANLSGVNLKNANLSGAQLNNTDLWQADLSGANLSSADLSGSKLRANLSGANLDDADLNDSDLCQANLSNANLRNVRNLTEQQIRYAVLSNAQLPKDLNITRLVELEPDMPF